MSTAALGREDGTLTIWMLGLCVTILFLGGLSLDLWRAFTERRELAGVVDAAAVAAGSAIDEATFREDGILQLEPALARTIACDELRRRTAPPLTCEGVSADAAGVEVTARRDIQLTLVRVLLHDEEPLTIEVSARAEPRLGE